MFSKKKSLMRTNTIDMRLDKQMFDVIDSDINCSIAWYILAQFSKNELDENLIEENSLVYLSKKIVSNWDTLEHKHKDYLTVDIVKKLDYSGDYPKNTHLAVKTLKSIRDI